jgi:hypothetical protein
MLQKLTRAKNGVLYFTRIYFYLMMRMKLNHIQDTYVDFQWVSVKVSFNLLVTLIFTLLYFKPLSGFHFICYIYVS